MGLLRTDYGVELPNEIEVMILKHLIYTTTTPLTIATEHESYSPHGKGTHQPPPAPTPLDIPSSILSYTHLHVCPNYRLVSRLARSLYDGELRRLKPSGLHLQATRQMGYYKPLGPPLNSGFMAIHNLHLLMNTEIGQWVYVAFKVYRSPPTSNVDQFDHEISRWLRKLGLLRAPFVDYIWTVYRNFLRNAVSCWEKRARPLCVDITVRLTDLNSDDCKYMHGLVFDIRFLLYKLGLAIRLTVLVPPDTKDAWDVRLTRDISDRIVVATNFSWSTVVYQPEPVAVEPTVASALPWANGATCDTLDLVCSPNAKAAL